MPRALNDIEKFYIANNRDKSANEIASKIQGVGAKTVQRYIDSLSTEADVSTVVASEPPVVSVEPQAEAVKTEKAKVEVTVNSKGETVLKGQTEEEKKQEYTEIIRNGPIAGDLFARQPGVVVLTEAASELADARKTLSVKSPDPNAHPDKIFRIRK